MMEGRPYQVEETMKETSLSRRMKAFAMLNLFEYGSLWVVGENIWKAKLPEYYVQREDRMEHPAICVKNESVDRGIHAVVPMWYGTTLDKDRGRHLGAVRAGKRYVLKNFYNNPKEADHRTMFGDFRPVPIEKEYLGISSVVMKSDEKRKNTIRLNTARRLDAHEKEELSRFTRGFFALG